MGGCGSGPQWTGKETTAAYQQLDARLWQREGLLVRFGSFVSGDWRVEVRPPFNVQGQPQWLILSRWDGRRDETPPIRLAWTPCNYGGSRVWFHCPIRNCGRRVAILYCDGTTLSCRHCRELSYPSQQESDKYRALYRAQEIRAKLGGSPCIVDPFPEKPKGMHSRTYQRLQQEAERKEMFFLSR